MSGIKFSCLTFLAFNFCWIPLLVETLRLHLCFGAFIHVYTVYCILFRYSLHCSSLQPSRPFHLANCLFCFRDIRCLVFCRYVAEKNSGPDMLHVVYASNANDVEGPCAQAETVSSLSKMIKCWVAPPMYGTLPLWCGWGGW